MFKRPMTIRKVLLTSPSNSWRLRLLKLLVCAICLTTLPVGAFAAGTVNFATAPAFLVGKRARTVAIGDFNGDGLPDIAVAGLGSNFINVLLACKTGTTCVNGFLPAVNYSVGTPVSVVAADVNGDGKLDLLVVSAGGNSATLFIGHGDGTFSTGHCAPSGGLCITGLNPVAIAIGNFIGKAKEVDMAVVNSGDNTISVFLGNGVGFNAPKKYAVGNSPTSVAVGDFNGDGFPDLVVTNGADGTAVILLGNGKGTFTAQTPFATGATPVSVAAADFNGDKTLDLAIANSSGNSVSIFLGVGNGTFQPPTNLSAGLYPQSVAIGDFKNLGHSDLAVADGSGNNVSVLLSNGDGTFQPGVQYASGAKTVFAAVADMNGNGRQDLVVANADLVPGQVTILYGNGDGTFQSALSYPTGLNPQGIVSGDFNCDHKQDLAVVNAGANTVSLLLGNGNGTFQAGSTLNTDNHPVGIVTADFNHDGIPDLAVVNSASGDVTVLLGNSTCAGFNLPVNYNLGAGVNPVSIAAADFNGDTYMDLVVADAGSSTNPGGVIVLLNNHDGTFGSPIASSGPTNPNFVAAGDLNADGKQDVVVTNQTTGSVSALLGNGDGTFSLKSNTCVGNTLCKGVPVAVAVADLNGDGKLDLAVANYNDVSVTVLFGNGDGTFALSRFWTAGANPLYVVAAPIQGNKTQQDLVVAGSENDTVCVMLNQLNRSGQFRGAAQRTYAAGEAPAALALADFTGDGKLDIAVANQASNNVTVIEQK